MYMLRLLLNHQFNLSLLDKKTIVMIPHVSRTFAVFWSTITFDINSLINTDVNRTEIKNVNIIFTVLTEGFSQLAMWHLMGKIYSGNDLVELETDFCTALLLNSTWYMAYVCIPTHVRTFINTCVYVHTYIHTYTRTYTHTRTYIHTFTYAFTKSFQYHLTCTSNMLNFVSLEFVIFQSV
jgi:hypothetical protein